MADSAAERINGIKPNTTPAAEFVRGLSADLTLREMLEKVKAAGHDIGKARVYQIRKDEKLGFKYMTAVPPEPKLPTTAAEFVRALSPELTLREMHAKIQAAGFELSEKRVYNIRHEEKLGFKHEPHAGGRKKKKTKQKPVVRVTAKEALAAIPVAPKGDNAKVQLRKLAFQYGIDWIEALIRELKHELGL